MKWEPKVHEDILMAMFQHLKLTSQDWANIMDDLKDGGYTFTEGALRYDLVYFLLCSVLFRLVVFHFVLLHFVDWLWFVVVSHFTWRPAVRHYSTILFPYHPILAHHTPTILLSFITHHHCRTILPLPLRHYTFLLPIHHGFQTRSWLGLFCSRRPFVVFARA